MVEGQDDVGMENDGLEVWEEDQRRILLDGGDDGSRGVGVVADNTDWVGLARLHSCQVTIHRHSRTRKSAPAPALRGLLTYFEWGINGNRKLEVGIEGASVLAFFGDCTQGTLGFVELATHDLWDNRL